jgi:hypothetical protein
VSGSAAQSVAVALAITAAATFAVANVLQQRVAAKLRSHAAFDTAVLLHLIRRPLWLAGLALVIVSLALQATALALAARADRRRMRPIEWLAALATFAGLAVFLSVAHPSGGQPTAQLGQLGLAAVVAVIIAVTSSLVAVRMSPLGRALTLGVGGGIAAGVTDALTKTVADLAGGHQLGVFADARLYLLAVIGLLTYTMQQNGYRAAGMAAFLPVFSVLDPVVGSLLGLLIYHEHLGGGAGRIALEVAAGLAATWGICRLARSTAQAEPIETSEPIERIDTGAPIEAGPLVLQLPPDPVLAAAEESTVPR